MTKEQEGSVPSNPEKSDYLADNQWLIRSSSVYEGEYKECSSLKGRLHQYFIYGKTLDCSQWKRDSNNCLKWEESRDEKAGVELINSERARRKERLSAHINNDTWEKRTSPPENWNSQLPEHILQTYEFSYLNTKAKELRGELPRSSDVTFTSSFCTIL